MKRFALAHLLVLSASAHAAAPWLSLHGRVTPSPLLLAYGTLGGAAAVGFSLPDGVGLVGPAPEERPRASLLGEASFDFLDRVAELRVGRQWQLTAPRLFTLSATLAGAAFFVPEGRTDVGLGPHGALALGIGGDTFCADLGLQAGAEAFVQGGVRFPVRLGLGLTARFRQWTLGLNGRTGVDVSPTTFFRVRAEAMVVAGWYGPW